LKALFPLLLAGLAACLTACLAACNHDDKHLVNASFIDSLIRNYTPPAVASDNEKERLFWLGRIDPGHPGYVNESRYAGSLNMAFRLSGEIDSLRRADSILAKVDEHFNHHEASALLALVSHRVTEHRFMDADSLLGKAKQIGLRPNESLTTSFDVDFELGRYTQARAELNSLRNPNDFGYYFRKSKVDHLDGELDSSIADMDRAAALAGKNLFLRGVALSNEADLNVHAEDLEKAHDEYVECIRMNSADMHSLVGLGWIALVHDHDHNLAEKIFRFAGDHTRLPDPLFKMTQAAGAEHDSIRQTQYAKDFTVRATNPIYGRMYNKYLLQLYTGILRDPAKAELLAMDELHNRATPQTYAWYAWSLFANGKKDQAYTVFEQHVSGQPLEGLELYWMGRLMEGLNKNYNAQQFFLAAQKTRFDLDPADAEYIHRKLAE
jgi:tetratricopeptide (TPR) repeat protein